jgi:excisionase family DNA binding protein
MPRKEKAVDSSGNTVEVMTVGQAAKYLGMTKSEVKLQLFAQRNLPSYKVIGKKGTKIIRIRKKDLDDFVVDQKLYDNIADRIVLARSETVVVKKGISQTDLAKDARCTITHMNHVERKKARVGIKLLKKIAEITDKPFDWFFEGAVIASSESQNPD